MCGLIPLLLVSTVAFADPPPGPQRLEGEELQEILKKWEEATAEIETAEMQFQRWVYDENFAIERRSSGTFYFEAPNKGRLEIRGENQSGRRFSGKKTQYGRRFELVSGKSQTGVWTGKKLYSIDPERKTYEVFTIPDEKEIAELGWYFRGIIEGLSTPQRALPFIVDVSLEEVERNFEVSGAVKTRAGVRFLLTPKTDKFEERFKRVEIILDPETYRTSTVQYIGPGESSRTVYRFGVVRLNEPKPEDERRLKPDLEGYLGTAFLSEFSEVGTERE